MTSMAPRRPAGFTRISTNRRLSIWYAVILFIIAVIVIRLFYLQIIKYDHYHQAALSDQLKQYTIAPQRGIIEAHEGNSVIPLVLNQQLYTLYADPTLVKDPGSTAQALAKDTGGSADQYQRLMQTKNTRYVVLAKRLTKQQNDMILGLKLAGVGLQSQDYRTYPQGDLAAQVLGFVNDAGQGTYGIEQQFNGQLAGKPGLLKAITDVNGVPLAASRNNIDINPQPGDNVVLTINIAMQQQIETILQQAEQKVHAKSISAVLMNPNTGKIYALANYPTFDPSKFYDVSDLSVFNDPAISHALEVGSIMKTLSISTGLNEGAISPDTSYYDPGSVTVDGFTIKNVLSIPAEPVTIPEILKYSLNTGAVHTLKELGGGQLNQQGRDLWYSYMTGHFQLGKATGIELPNEASGVIPDPDHGYALNLQYANTSFGQGMTATILQMVSAFSSVINGGTYYKPYIVDQMRNAAGATIQRTGPSVVKKNVIKPQVSQEMQGFLEYVFQQNYNVYQTDQHPGYNVGGKTGTAQVAGSNGVYLPGVYNGTFLGFVGKDKPQYAVGIFVDKPDLSGADEAGGQAAAPVFGKIADMLINDFGGEAAPD